MPGFVLQRAQPPASCRHLQCIGTHPVIRKCCQGHQRIPALGDGHNELFHRVDDASGDEFAKRPRTIDIRLRQRAEIRLALTAPEHDRRVATAYEKQIEQKASSTPVSIEERMNPHDLASQMFLNTFADFHQRVMVAMSVPAASHGQCVPGLIKCHVDTVGSLHMCERVGEERPIGNVKEGFDTKAIEGFLSAYDIFLREACSRCWAVRLCHKCYVQFRKKDGFSSSRLDEFCEGERRRLDWLISEYASIREANVKAFAWCRDLVD